MCIHRANVKSAHYRAPEVRLSSSGRASGGRRRETTERERERGGGIEGESERASEREIWREREREEGI